MLVIDQLTCRPPRLKDKLLSRLLFAPHYARRKLLPPITPEQENLLATLREDGFVVMPGYIAPDILQQLQAELENAMQNLRFAMPTLAQSRIDRQKHKALIDNFMFGTPQQLKAMGVTFDREEAQSYEQVLRDFNPSTLTVHMLELSETYRKVWLDPFILGVISHYLGMVPSLAEAYVRRNFPAPHRSMNHYWHRDLNHTHLIKMFVFISDCKIENGPHEYIKQTHRRPELLNGKRYFSDQEVDALYPNTSTDRAMSVVKAGTVVLEDTHGVHRACLPTAGHRDLGFGVFMPLRPFYPHKNYNFPVEALAELSDLQRAVVLPNSWRKPKN